MPPIGSVAELVRHALGPSTAIRQEESMGPDASPGAKASTAPASDEPVELDLTASDPVPGPAQPRIRQVPVEVEKVREGMRGRIALGLLLVIFSNVVGAFAASGLHWAAPADLKDLLTQVYNPLIGLFGAVIGFYFGSMGTGSTTTTGSVTTRPISNDG